jgi:hypothetical protein
MSVFDAVCTTKMTAEVKDAECSVLQNEIVVEQIIPKLARRGGQSAESVKVFGTGLEFHSACPAYHSDASYFQPKFDLGGFRPMEPIFTI